VPSQIGSIAAKGFLLSDFSRQIYDLDGNFCSACCLPCQEISISQRNVRKKAKRQILIERSIKRNIDIRSDNLGVLSASIEAS
jgi:hypothetical protein